MITEDYVSFEIAKLLKEKGFDKDVWGTDLWYDENGELHHRGNYSYSGAPFYYKETCCNAPTLQMAMKWLREKHNLFIVITTWLRHKDGYYYEIRNLNDDNFETLYDYTSKELDSYEKACDAAIKYCLENLI